MTTKIWQLKEADPQLVKRVSEENGVDEFQATILVNRGLTEKRVIDLYLHPEKERFHDPFLMPDMQKAVTRIIGAQKNYEPLCIYGDYDVDGITSTSILYLFLKEIGCHVRYYIPDRLTEGYGLNSGAIEKLKNEDISLMITVDTGIAAVAEAETAKRIGMDLIITDHHECQDIIPQGYAVINPKRPDSQYPFDQLAGVGVTFKLIQGIARTLGVEELIWKYLDIAAIGTVADIVPLQDENRIITKLAFKTIPTTWNIGLKALMKVADLVPERIGAGMIGFQIGPRLNAAGRLGDAKRGVALFTTEDESLATEIAEELDRENRKRQEMEVEIFEKAVELVESGPDISDMKMLVIAHHGWSHGVIGIVASRLVEKYYRPTILLTIEDGVASGSARSVEGFNLFEALSSCKDLFKKFGGHEMAAGMSLPQENVDSLRQRLNDYAQAVMDDTTLIPKLHADLELSLQDACIERIEGLSIFEPFGMGNEEPKFICHGLLKSSRIIGKTMTHLRVEVAQNGDKIAGIGFGMAERESMLGIDQPVSVFCTLNINEWQQKKSPQLMVKDIKSSQEAIEDMNRHLMQLMKGDDGVLRRAAGMDWIPARKDYERVYRFFLALDKQLVCQVYLSNWMASMEGATPVNWVKYILCLEVFQQLGLIFYTLEADEIHFKINKGNKVELNMSKLYNKLIAYTN